MSSQRPLPRPSWWEWIGLVCGFALVAIWVGGRALRFDACRGAGRIGVADVDRWSGSWPTNRCDPVASINLSSTVRPGSRLGLVGAPAELGRNSG